MQGWSSGKNKVCSFKECSGGQWARGRLWEGMVGAKAGCRPWRETHWEKGKESMRSRIPESSSRLSQCHTLACSDLRSHVLPGVLMMMPGGGEGSTVV